MVVRCPGFARGQRKPGRARRAAAQRHTPAQAAAAAADEGHQCRRIHRARPEAPGHPGPARADLRPAAVVRGGEAPGRVVHPGPTPGLDPGPAAVAVRRPVGHGAGRVPDAAVSGILCPLAPGVELGVTGHIARQILRRAGALLQRVARGDPLVEAVAQRRGGLGDEQIAPDKRHLLAVAHAGRLAGAAIHRGAAGVHRQARGVAARVDVDAVFAGLLGHHGQLRGVDLDPLARLQLAHAQRQAAVGQRQLGGVVVEPGDAQIGRAGQARGGPAALQLGARAGVDQQPGAGAHRPVQAGRLQVAAVGGDLRRAFQRADVGHAGRWVGLRPAEQRRQQQGAATPAAPGETGKNRCHGLCRAGTGSPGCTGSHSTRQHRRRFARPGVGRAKSGRSLRRNVTGRVVGRWCRHAAGL